MGPVALCAACAGAPRPTTAPVLDDDNDPTLASVVRLRGSTYCSGVLVTATRVVTAAHCVAGLRSLPDVYVGPSGARGGGRVVAVSRCEMHPGAYDGTTDCLRPLRPGAVNRVARGADVAVLELAARVPRQTAEPLALAYDRADLVRLAGRRVRVTGWISTALVGGEVGRAAGWHQIVVVRDGVVATLPAPGLQGQRGFAHQPGDSGGPCLLRDGGRERVIGVLSGGSGAYSADSLYASTFGAVTAAWLRDRVVRE